MGRRVEYYNRTRSSHKSKLDWIIIDLAEFRRRCLSEKPPHQGTFLEELVRQDAQAERSGKKPRVAVGRAYGATSHPQARYFAANGQTADAFDAAKEPKKTTFSSQSKFAAVEMRVLKHLVGQPLIDWNLERVRRGIYLCEGEDALWHLCARFQPSGPLPSSDAALSAALKRKTSTTYRIVDLDEFRSSLDRARNAMRGKRSTVRVHEGTLLQRATTTARITANASWRALQLYRERVQGTMSVLPPGMFMAIAEIEWEDLIARATLPDFYGKQTATESPDAPAEEPFRLESDVEMPKARESCTRVRIVRRPHKGTPDQQKLPFGA